MVANQNIINIEVVKCREFREVPTYDLRFYKYIFQLLEFR